MSPSGPQPRLVQVYGLRIRSDYPFEARLPAVAGEPDLEFSCVERLTLPPGRRPVYRSAARIADGREAFRLDRAGAVWLLDVAGVGEFAVDGEAIRCRPAEGAGTMVEVALLGTALSLWLELRGVPALHAAVVELDGGAVAFLAERQGGKSCLAAACLREGDRLVSDDIAALSVEGEAVTVQPGYPQMRLWPSDAAYFVPPEVPTERLHPRLGKRRVPVGESGFGCFRASPALLRAVLLPRRGASESGVELTEAGPARAVFELTRHSFIGRTAEALGLGPARFKCFSEIARRVPFLRLAYPEGLDRLPDVRRAIRRTLNQISDKGK